MKTNILQKTLLSNILSKVCLTLNGSTDSISDYTLLASFDFVAKLVYNLVVIIYIRRLSTRTFDGKCITVELRYTWALAPKSDCYKINKNIRDEQIVCQMYRFFEGRTFEMNEILY